MKRLFYSVLLLTVLVFILMVLSAKGALSAEYESIAPSAPLYDNNEGLVQAHGGSIIWDDSTEKYYLYGEARKTSVIPQYLKRYASWGWRIGVACYSSSDLYSWKYEGLALYMLDYGDSKEYPQSDIQVGRVLERPKVIYNEKTHKYVMWMHIDSSNYGQSRAGVAVSDNPTGPFEYLGSYRPGDKMARDMTVFKDDDGKAYIYFATDENASLACCALSDDYLECVGDATICLSQKRREAPALFKYNSTYYMITSGCSGWDANAAAYATASSPMGKWTQHGNPCTGTNASKTFGGQSTFVLPLDAENGKFMFMADIWKPSNQSESGYMWLPITIKDDKSIAIAWLDEWRIGDFVGAKNIAPIGNIVLNAGSVYETKIDSHSYDVRLGASSDNVSTALVGDTLRLYALRDGVCDLSIRVGGGGWSGTVLKSAVTVGEKARAYAQSEGAFLINATDALLNTEYAQTFSKDYHQWSAKDGYAAVLPDTNAQWSENALNTAPSMAFRLRFDTCGEYYVAFNCSHPDISGNSFFVGLDGEYLFTQTGEESVGENLWLYDNAWKLNITEPGVHTLNIYAREDASAISRIALSKTLCTSADALSFSPLCEADFDTLTLSGADKIGLDLKFNIVPDIITEDITFTSYFGSSVLWQCDSAVSPNGTVKRGAADAYLSLKGYYTNGNDALDKEYSVCISRDEGEIKSVSDFSTVKFQSVKDRSFLTFDIAVNTQSDGCVSLCPSSFTPHDWADYPVTFRIRPEGTFDARNGAEYGASESVSYKTNRVYRVCLDLNVSNNTYCVYVTDPIGNVRTVADNFSFRFPVTELGKMTVRSGNYVDGGLFTVKNISVNAGSFVFLNAYSDNSLLRANIASYAPSAATLYAAFYKSGTLVKQSSMPLNTPSAQTKEIKLRALEDYDEAQLMLFDKNLTPLATKRVENKRPEGFRLPTGELTSSAQSAEAFHKLPLQNKSCVYSFTLVDNGSADSGIMIGDSEFLCESSANYFASGSIVLLFANGRLYTRTNEAKTLVGEYEAGEAVNIKIIADITDNTYDLYIDNVLAAEDTAFRNAANKLDIMALVENNGGSMFNIGNFILG